MGVGLGFGRLICAAHAQGVFGGHQKKKSSPHLYALFVTLLSPPQFPHMRALSLCFNVALPVSLYCLYSFGNTQDDPLVDVKALRADMLQAHSSIYTRGQGRNLLLALTRHGGHLGWHHDTHTSTPSWCLGATLEVPPPPTVLGSAEGRSSEQERCAPVKAEVDAHAMHIAYKPEVYAHCI